MRLTRFVLAALLCALTTAAHAQCTGVFASGYTCGNAAATSGTGRAVPFISIFQRVMGSTANATLVTDGSGVPSVSQTLPAAVQGNITRLGAVTTITSLTGLPAPSVASAAATKDYVDSTASGRHYHPAATVATASVVLPNSPSYSNGASGVGATLTAGSNAALVVDGTTVSVLGTYVLVKDQASTLQNGEYTLTTAGNGATPWVLTRATTMDTPSELGGGDTVFVSSGSTNANTTWTQTQTITTIGTDPILFVNTGGAGNNTWGTSSTDIFNNNAGNVGIGTGSPATKMHVVGSIRFASLTCAGAGGVPVLDASGNLTCQAGSVVPGGAAKGDALLYTAANATSPFKATSANGAQWGDPTGVVSSSAGLVNAYGYIKRVILSPGTYKLSTTASWPSNVEWIIPCGATLKPDNTVAITINGVVTEPTGCQIFDQSAGGVVKGMKFNHVGWWGAVPDGSTNSTAAIQSANTSLAASTGSAGGYGIIQFGCGSAYIVQTTISLTPTEPISYRVQGCGPGTGGTRIQGATAGTFTRSIVEVVGSTVSSGLVIFEMRDLAIISETHNRSIQCLTLGTSAGTLQGTNNSRIANVVTYECNVGIGMYATRNFTFDNVEVSLPGETNAIGLLWDANNNTDNNGEQDFYGLIVNCIQSASTPNGVGTGMRFKTTQHASSGLHGVRFYGNVMYHCAQFVDMTASLGNIGEVTWTNSQWDGNGGRGIQGVTSGTGNITKLTFDNLYLQGMTGTVFDFQGGTAATITELAIINGQFRGIGANGGTGVRFGLFSNVTNLVIANNRLTSFAAQVAPTNELIYLNAVDHGAITGNVATPSGIPAAVPYFITLTGGTDVVCINGNSMRSAVTSLINGSQSNSCTSGNNP